MLPVQEVKDAFNEQVKNTVKSHTLFGLKLDWSTLDTALDDAKKTLNLTQKNTLTGWFELSKELITPLIKERTRILQRVQQDLSIPVKRAKEMCIAACKNVNEAISVAKSRWANKLALQVRSMKLTPKEAWQAVRDLQSGLTGHHIKPTIMKFKLPNGDLSKHDEEHMSVLQPHFAKVFNNHQKIDWRVLDEIRQHPLHTEIDGNLTYLKFSEAIQSLKNHTASGLNGITGEEIKALDKEVREYHFEIIWDYFNDDIDIPEWHWGNLRALPKSGDLTSPHKWRGINLLDTACKIMSSIVTKRLQCALTHSGYPHQFGSTPRTGCPDANLMLKSILQLRREMDKDSWVVFLDLVKAFDTAHHQLLYQLMAKFGIPKRVIRVVKKLYTSFKMELKMGKAKSIIEYLTRVKQGDVLAPKLFVFVMQAIAECVLQKWKDENITPFTYHCDGVEGKMCRHKDPK